MKKKLKTSKKWLGLMMAFTFAFVMLMPTTVNAETNGDMITNYTETISKASTVYAGQITVDGELKMYYLYSADLTGHQIIYDNLKRALPSNFAGLIPTAASGETGLKVSSSHQEDMDSNWNSSSYVANQTYTIHENESATFKINADYSLFENDGKVYVDDALVSADNYTSKSGSTIITFTKEYMNSLSEGEHTLKVAFNNGGTAITKFKIAKASTTEDTTTEATTTETTTTAVDTPAAKVDTPTANADVQKTMLYHQRPVTR